MALTARKQDHKGGKMTFNFQKTTKKQARLRLALIGPSGSGKTYSALKIASHLANGGRVAVIDTEHGSALTRSLMPGLAKRARWNWWTAPRSAARAGSRFMHQSPI